MSASSVLLMFTPVMPRPRPGFINTSVALMPMRPASICRFTEPSIFTTFLWAERSWVTT
ncbi:MAG: hypothetical protein U0263_32720 [Polyangiaceae bacterium]